MYDTLFSPIKIGGIEVRNRIAMMPMGVFSPRLMGSDGAYTKEGADYYIERAKGGTGLIITGLVPIVPNPVFYILGAPQSYVEKTKYLTEGIHAQDSKVFIQLTALTGRAGHGGEFPAPSELPNVWDPTIKSRMITKDEIQLYIKNFAKGAALVKEAGGDGVEIHAVHEGYLLDQFVIACMNTRTDEYGGSLENRLRFPVEIVQVIKAECGNDFPVSLRYSVRSYIKDFNRGALPGEKFEEMGRDLAESLLIARKLEEAGYDLLNCDNGSYDSWYWSHPPMYMPKACNLEDVAAIKEAVSIPVVCAGRFDNPKLADDSITAGKMDMLGMGRPLLADPEIANKFKEGKLEEIRPCISCHQGCLGRIFQGLDISCAVNPACGRENSYRISPAEKQKKIMIVGGGLGGMEAARVCALRGHEVDLFEKSGQLGGIFVAASAPEFKGDDKHLLMWYKNQMAELPINVKMNTEVTKEMAASGAYDEIFVATGAHERHLMIPGLNATNTTYAVDTLLRAELKGENILIIGGGLTGCEMAYDLSRKGKKVTVIEMTETILNSWGLSASNYNMLMDLMDYYKVNVIKNAVVEAYADGIATVRETIKNYPNIANRAKLMFAVGTKGMPSYHKIPVDHFVVSVGYTGDDALYQEIKGEHVYLIGDAKHPSNILEAIWGAYEVAKDL
ncbi:MAG: FAD-dependent oxidoreductase [Lachnospiraceae bacterium]